MRKKVIVYVRKSRDMDRDILEKNIETVTDLAEMCGDTEYELVAEISPLCKGTFTPEFSKVVKMIERGEVEKIYTFSISNFHRDMKLMAELANLLRKQGVKVFENSPIQSKFTDKPSFIGYLEDL